MIAFVTFVFLAWVLGWGILDCFSNRLTWWEKLGLSLFMGIGTHTAVYYLLVTLPRPWIIPSLVLLGGEILLTYIVRKLVDPRGSVPVKLSKTNHWGKMWILFSVLIFGYSFIQAAYWPPYVPDAVKLYDFRAQRILESGGGINQEILTNKSYGYPPFTSLVHFFLYQAGAENPQPIYPTFLVAFWLFIGGYVARRTGSSSLGWGAALAVIFTPSIMWSSFLSITNLVVMEYLTLAILLLNDDGILSPPHLGLITGLLTGLSMLIRREGMWLVPMVLSGLTALRVGSLRLLVIFLLVMTLVYSLWQETDFGNPVPVSPVGQVAVGVQVITALATQTRVTTHQKPDAKYVLLAVYRSWGAVLFLYLAIFAGEMVFLRAKVQRIHLGVWLTIGVLTVGFMILGSRFEYWMILGDSLTRMAVVAIPLFWVAIFESPLLRYRHK